MLRKHRTFACQSADCGLALTIVLVVTVACIAAAHPNPAVPLEVEYGFERLLSDLLVAVSEAQAMVDQAYVEPCLYLGQLDWKQSWVMLADLALRATATMCSAGESLAVLVGNLQASLQRVGDLAADLLGPFPLIIEVLYPDPTDIWSDETKGWFRLDAESLRSAQIPDLIEANLSTQALSRYASALARKIAPALGLTYYDRTVTFWERGYVPGVGVFVNVSMTDFPADMNTVSEWVEALSRIVGELDSEPLASLAEGESLIVNVGLLQVGFHFDGRPVHFVIGSDSLDDPDSWRICYPQ